MSQTENATLPFARQILQIGKSGLTNSDRDQLRRLMLDCLGVSRMSATLPWTQSLIDWAGRFRNSGLAPMVGTNISVDPSIAALINGTAAHGYELDDTHEASMSHPGSVVISAALAVAAELGSSADATLSAIASGYEALTRIGMAAGGDNTKGGGFHPTALFGPFGAAAAAAQLMGLDEYGLARAWGHALSLTGGSMQFSDEPKGTTVKRLHSGYAAQNGVLAAEFAARGIEAPARALDGKYGFLPLYSPAPEFSELVVPADKPLQIHLTSFKPYSCGRLFHAMIDGLREVTDNFSLKPEAITDIEVRGPRILFDQHMLRRPTSVVAAQYSMPFVAGATIVYGSDRFDIYREDKLKDPAILMLADRLNGEADPEIEAYYPAKMGSSVKITLADGTQRSAKVIESRGSPGNPLSTEAVYAKAEGLLRDVEPQFDLAAARTTLWSDANGRDLARLFSLR